MSIFRKRHGFLVAVHADNANSKDWLVLLEAATIVGQQRDKLRVALTTKERHLVKKRRLFRASQYFLVIDGYDPRIHAIYFCPQLYKKNEDGELAALSGPEIGRLMAQALEGGAIEKPPWYEPLDGAPEQAVISSGPGMELDSLVVDAPILQENRPAALISVAVADRKNAKT
jgi:hypothetical protein